MITTFGEIMLRISPRKNNERLTQAVDFVIEPGGSEANVAIALSNLGTKSKFLSKIAKNPFSTKIINFLKQFGVDTNDIIIDGDKLGIYFTENGISIRNSFVIYDRKNSAFCDINESDFNWQKLLEHSKWFHFSGISPAVSQKVFYSLKGCTETIKIPYSIDLNYRATLWDWAKQNKEDISSLMSQLCAKATLIAGNESDFQNCLGIEPIEGDEEQQFNDIAFQCFNRFPASKYIAISNRRSISASKNEWSGYLYVQNEQINSFMGREYIIDNIQDRVGTGDSFIAGILFGLNYRTEWSYKEVIDFAVSLSALNHTIMGDASRFTEDEVMLLMKTNGSGRIIR